MGIYYEGSHSKHMRHLLLTPSDLTVIPLTDEALASANSQVFTCATFHILGGLTNNYM